MKMIKIMIFVLLSLSLASKFLKRKTEVQEVIVKNQNFQVIMFPFESKAIPTRVIFMEKGKCDSLYSSSSDPITEYNCKEFTNSNDCEKQLNTLERTNVRLKSIIEYYDNTFRKQSLGSWADKKTGKIILNLLDCSQNLMIFKGMKTPKFVIRYLNSYYDKKDKANKYTSIKTVIILNLMQLMKELTLENIIGKFNEYANFLKYENQKNLPIQLNECEDNKGDLTIEFARTTFLKLFHQFLYLIVSSCNQNRKVFYLFKLESKQGNSGETEAFLSFYSVLPDLSSCLNITPLETKKECFKKNSESIRTRFEDKYHYTDIKIKNSSMKDALYNQYSYVIQNNEYHLLNQNCQKFTNNVIKTLEK